MTSLSGSNADARPSHHAATSRLIALTLLLVFAAALAATAYSALYSDPADRTHWRELFKSALLVLGGSLTSVVGYYFGSRGVQEAENSAQLTRGQMEELKQQLQLSVKETETQKRLLDQIQRQALEPVGDAAPTTDGQSLELPDITPEDGADR